MDSNTRNIVVYNDMNLYEDNVQNWIKNRNAIAYAGRVCD